MPPPGTVGTSPNFTRSVPRGTPNPRAPGGPASQASGAHTPPSTGPGRPVPEIGRPGLPNPPPPPPDPGPRTPERFDHDPGPGQAGAELRRWSRPGAASRPGANPGCQPWPLALVADFDRDLGRAQAAGGHAGPDLGTWDVAQHDRAHPDERPGPD